MTTKDIGATIRALRIQHGLTTTALAAEIGISQPQVSRLEKGRQVLRADTAIRIAKALNVPTFRLFMTEKEWAQWRRLNA